MLIVLAGKAHQVWKEWDLLVKKLGHKTLKQIEEQNVEICCVADQFCLAPANLEPPVRARCVCFRCGLAVCSKCSSKREYPPYGRQRLCHNCIAEIEGNEESVLRKLRRMAGVKG